MKPDDKFSWLLRQTGTVAEMSLLQTFVIACSHREMTVDGRVFPPFHVWLSPAEIAHRSGLHERTVPEIVERLKQRGLIESAGRHGKTGQIRVHRLLIDATESPKESSPLENGSPRESSPLHDAEGRAFLHERTSLSASKDEPFCNSLIRVKRDIKQRSLDLPAEGSAGTGTDIAEKSRKSKKPRQQPVTAGTWDAYAAAYETRYGVQPVRNSKVNGQLANLVKQLGPEEAPQVAAFYVTHDEPFYIKKGHDVGLLLADAAKLRMEWITGRRTSGMNAQEALEAGNRAVAKRFLQKTGFSNNDYGKSGEPPP